MITDKITIEDLLIRVLPGGFLIALFFFVLNLQLSINNNLDFLYSFFFFCTAFIIGEVLQTISHSLEFVINIFFKGYKPSEIFLYKKNPIIPNEKIRQQLITSLKLSNNEKKFFEKEYKNIPLICSQKDSFKQISQSYFWEIYGKVEDDQKIKRSNIDYLFLRVITIDFLISFIFLILYHHTLYGVISLIVFLILLWRARGLARGLVFKSILVYLK